MQYLSVPRGKQTVGFSDGHIRGKVFMRRTAYLLVLIIHLLPMMIISEEFIETIRVYDMHFDYDPFSAVGPRKWHLVDSKAHDGWAEFDLFQGGEIHNLDIKKNECSSRRRPSPLNLRVNNECGDKHEILSRKIKAHDCTIDNMRFEIAPHLLRANMPYNDTYCRRPSIDMPNGLPNDWILTWVEVHARSEHVVDGRRYDGEMNFIHVGLDSQNKYVGSPTVLLDASGTRDHPLFQRFLDRWQAIADRIRDMCNARRRGRRDLESQSNAAEKYERGQWDVGPILERYRSELPAGDRLYDRSEYTGTYDDDDFVSQEDEHLRGIDYRVISEDGATLDRNRGLQVDSRAARRKIFPYDMWPTIYYYRYQGSLTYPPCSEIVHWRIFDEPLVISRRQFKQLATLISGYVNEHTCKPASVTSPRGENIRPLQVVNDVHQNVTHCTANNFTYWKYAKHKQ